MNLNSHLEEVRMRRCIVPLLLCGFVLVCAGRAHAGILSVAGSMSVLTPPVDISAEGSFESSATIYVIDEGISIVPPSPPILELDVFGPGTVYTAGGPLPPPLILPVGMPRNSYLIHFDKAVAPAGPLTLSGSVTFDVGEVIHGLQVHTPLLYTTDGPFGIAGVTYPGAFISTRGFDSLPAPADTVTIAGDLNSVSFSLTTELGIDQVRIFTIPVLLVAEVPEPASGTVIAIGAVICAAIGLIRRRRPPQHV